MTHDEPDPERDDDFENYDDFDYYDDPLEDAMMDCGQLPDGTCTKAGSEECDFECPFSQ